MSVIVAFTFAIALWYYLYHKVTSSNRLRPLVNGAVHFKVIQTVHFILIYPVHLKVI